MQSKEKQTHHTHFPLNDEHQTPSSPRLALSALSPSSEQPLHTTTCSGDLPWRLPLSFCRMLYEFNFIFNFATKALFKFPHHSGLNTVSLSTKKIPEAAHPSSGLGWCNLHTGSNWKPAENSSALHWAGPRQRPRSTAGLFRSSCVQDMARAIWLSTFCASGAKCFSDKA